MDSMSEPLTQNNKPEPVKDTPLALIGTLIFTGIGVGIAFATNTLEECAVAYGVNYLSFLLVAWPLHTEKYYDLTGMLAFLSTDIFSIVYRQVPLSDLDFIRNIVLSSMVMLWTLRLGIFLFDRISNKHGGTDARFDPVRDNPCRFSLYWAGQGAWVYLLCLPLLIVNSFENPDVYSAASSSVTGLDVAGWVLWLFGWSFELIGDRQKTAFKNDPANRGKFCNVGLWSITRHPNYFGEITLWIGIAVSAASVASGPGWSMLAAPIYTMVLMLFVSGVPMAENTSLKKYGATEGYMEYIRTVSVLVPYLTCWTGWVGKAAAIGQQSSQDNHNPDPAFGELYQN